MTIKHIVISGGGPPGILAYGVYKELEKKGFWKLKDIKSIYGCSMGAILSVMLVLNYKWEWLDDYLMKRPWNKLVDINAQDIFNVYNEGGLLDDTGVYKLLSPLLKGKNLSEKLTMLELYHYSKIDVHIFSTNINKMEKIDISHKTHPDLPVYKAIYMSLTIPGVFKPICHENKCYIDGGYLNHFPIQDCMTRDDATEKEVLGIYISAFSEYNITEESSLSDIYFSLMLKLITISNNVEMDGYQNKNNIIKCKLNNSKGIMEWIYVLEDESKRREIIKQGEEEALQFLKKLHYKEVSKN